jgi:hypothetical protein
MLALRFMTQSRQGGTPERPSRNALWWPSSETRVIVSSPQLGQQRLCLYQVGGVETFGELGVDRREKVAGFGVAALVAAEPGEVRGGAQFPELGPLPLGDSQSYAIEFFGGVGMPLPQKLAFAPIQLRLQPALPCPPGDLQRIV